MVYKNIYNKRGVEPKNIESPFGIDELFFSITNKKGIIKSSNDVFVRVSKFEPEELIGKPHNTIRHPDMPRTIFKALWDTIKQKKPFIGYVKNMAKDGTYYWVLAAVYPILNQDGEIDEYLSIRLKPTSQTFQQIPKLYQKIQEIEIKEDMEKALEFMVNELKKMGYDGYEDFSKKIFYEEILSREKILNKDKQQSCHVDLSMVKRENIEFIHTLCDLQTLFFRINRYFNEIFEKVELFLNLNTELNNKSKFIYELAEDVRLLSLNASIESYKVKKEGVSFSTLSHEMRKNAELSENKIIQMSQVIDEVKKDIEGTGFNILTLKLIIEMITFFIKEMIQTFSKQAISEEKKQDIVTNIQKLFHLLSTFSKRLEENIYTSKSQFRTIYYNIQELNVLINRLDFIHINGLIESAHSKDEGNGFTIIFSQMLRLIIAAKQEIINLEKSITDASEENLTLDLITQSAELKISKIAKRYEEILS